MEQMNQVIDRWIRSHGDEAIALSQFLWSNPELPQEEFKACAQTKAYLERHGFSVRAYHSKSPEQEPNSVIATWGSGAPVVAIIGEYDALAGLGQEATSSRAPIPGCGHGCGHSMTTPACATAAIALKQAMEAEGLGGTVRFYATPAEESGEGKVYMKRNGDFDDVDCCLTWHPMGRDLGPEEGSMLAIASIEFEFFGKSAHAAAMPEMGRSALDAAELMNIGVQYLREHVSTDVRMHHIYLNGGESPNIVPDYAKLYYLIRARTMATLEEVLARVKEIAKGAAMMTGTQTKATLRAASCETFIVHGFNRFYYEAAKKVPPFSYSPEEQAFAKELYRNVMGKEPEGDILPTGLNEPTGVTRLVPASTDVGYITQVIPTSRMFGLGILRDIPMHHWGVTATAGMSIGHKAILQAARVVAQCGYEILQNPQVIEAWKAELREAAGKTPVYTPMIPSQTRI